MRHYTTFDKIYYTAVIKLGGLLAPISKKSGFGFFKYDEPATIRTLAGEQRVFGEIRGLGRVVDVRWHQGRVDISIAHGKWAAFFANAVLDFEWLPAGDRIGAPLVYAPTRRLVEDFNRHSYSILLHPQIDDQGRAIMPEPKLRALVNYTILALDPIGQEGVAVAMTPG